MESRLKKNSQSAIDVSMKYRLIIYAHIPLGMKYPFPVKSLIGMSSEIIPLRLVEDHKTDQQFTQRHFSRKNPEGLPPGVWILVPAAMPQLMIQHQHSSTFRLDHLQFLHDFSSVLFLFDLLGDEPLQHDL